MNAAAYRTYHVLRRWWRFGYLTFDLPLGRSRTLRVNAAWREHKILENGPRAYLSVGVGTGTDSYSALLQLYRTGGDLPAHTDCEGSNRIVWFLLWRATEGGDLVVDGPVRPYLGGRIKTFDGGTTFHSVTRITRGRRVSLILQHGSGGCR
ncbi:MAG TPA: hypothetical protein VNW93_05350 [Mycobacterium sp.]|nr:hypothetical protein [Mycobacterium sp.]